MRNFISLIGIKKVLLQHLRTLSFLTFLIGWKMLTNATKRFILDVMTVLDTPLYSWLLCTLFSHVLIGRAYLTKFQAQRERDDEKPDNSSRKRGKRITKKYKSSRSLLDITFKRYSDTFIAFVIGLELRNLDFRLKLWTSQTLDFEQFEKQHSDWIFFQW